MTHSDPTPSDFLATATEAALAAGGFLRSHFGKPLNVDAQLAHDIKLELDRRTQTLIESIILSRHPDHAILGEEGTHGDQSSPHQWIIDPLDGTVNFFYSIPHFATSIALRHQGTIIAGVIHDPMRDETWTVSRDTPALLNGLPIAVSTRTDLAEACVSVGVSKSLDSINSGLPLFEKMVRNAKKCRMLGSAALDMAYVSTGRLDAYIESQISIWDIAAGILLLEKAGGHLSLTPLPDQQEKFSIAASSGRLPLP
jgi:myo-inositol-1(or 4)-monophosphatase